jgi:electron transfer flavoprotein alpha/beta subunit
VEGLEIKDQKLRLKTTRENGYGLYESEFPLVAAVNKYAAKPRNMTVNGILRAVKQKIGIITSDDVKIESSNALEGSPTQVLGMEELKSGRAGLIIDDEDSNAAVRKAVERLKKLGVV